MNTQQKNYEISSILWKTRQFAAYLKNAAYLEVA
jgi:hypothetical protein